MKWKIRNRTFLLVLQFSMTAFWSYLCLRPPAEVARQPLFPREDLAHHFFGFFLHGILTLQTARAWRRPAHEAIAFCLLFGLSLEGLQGFLNWGRQAEVADMIANSMGVGLACLVFRTSSSQK